MDRIGGGDAFVGGLLYGILKGWQPEEWLKFGWATGALATTTVEDYATPADEKQVWSIYQGNARGTALKSAEASFNAKGRTARA